MSSSSSSSEESSRFRKSSDTTALASPARTSLSSPPQTVDQSTSQRSGSVSPSSLPSSFRQQPVGMYVRAITSSSHHDAVSGERRSSESWGGVSRGRSSTGSEPSSVLSLSPPSSPPVMSSPRGKPDYSTHNSTSSSPSASSSQSIHFPPAMSPTFEDGGNMNSNERDSKSNVPSLSSSYMSRHASSSAPTSPLGPVPVLHQPSTSPYAGPSSFFSLISLLLLQMCRYNFNLYLHRDHTSTCV